VSGQRRMATAMEEDERLSERRGGGSGHGEGGGSEMWEKILAEGRGDGRLVAESLNGGGSARLVDVPEELDGAVKEALHRIGIKRLYSHQAEAARIAFERDLIVTTGTASGKSLCFNVPTLDVLCKERRARALYLYPTKALAQDQARALAAMRMGSLVRPAIYDGDTPREARSEIRRKSNVVLTNPDMLHVGILPNHEGWAELLSNLAVVVMDEAHVYRGVFGSNVGNVIRRLRRIANAYGTSPRFILTSATIANPVELAERLTGKKEFALLNDDGSGANARQIAIWNPPLNDEQRGGRASAAGEGGELLAALVKRGARAICFVRSRRGVELLSRIVRERLTAGGDGELAEAVAPYRAGYTAEQRRKIEARLMSGELRAVVTTDALELGIDVGALDACIVVTFPGTVASLRQMWGRAGRRGRGLAVYVAGEDAMDQFFCRHPDEFLTRRVEAAILDHESEEIHLSHLLCAAYEGPLSEGHREFLGRRWESYAERLVGEGLLRKREASGGTALRAPSYVLRRGGSYPAGEVSLRSASAESFTIVDVEAGELLGSTEAARAVTTIHEGAIYLHSGRSYEVLELDVPGRRALVRSFDGDWYTQPKSETSVTIERLEDEKESHGCRVRFGEASVTETVLGYQRKRLSDHKEIDVMALDLPAVTFTTKALWFELERTLMNPNVDVEIPLESLLGALHATEHCQIAVLPLMAMCDRWDIGGLSTNLHPQTGAPTIFIYDGVSGGVGIARTAFARFDELCDDAHRLIRECRCEHGCPSCVQSPKCGNLNEPLSKIGAKLLLARMIAANGRRGAAGKRSGSERA
jgi:DEAD/DEAH box helicase domain-containing protein